MTNFLLIDTHNLLHRSRHAAKGDIFLKTGLAIHITLSSIRQAWTRFNADHVIFFNEGRSWRKDYYPAYKANRTKIRTKKSNTELEEDQIFYEMVDDFVTFINKHTNCTMLEHSNLEADDLIAGVIQKFDKEQPGQHHFTIVSTDSDFQQLISDNVVLYDGVQGKVYKQDGIFDEKGEIVVNKKGQQLEKPDPEWLLFEKCIRGDSSDNIMSAYPGARIKGTKSKIGIREAFEDRKDRGYDWNNFMMQRWTDHNDQEQQVKECYERNQMLIDLTAQPEDIRKQIDLTIQDTLESNKKVKNIGIRFLKFCGKYDLVKISQRPDPYVEFLSAGLNYAS